MSKYLCVALIVFGTLPMLQAQQMGKVFQADEFAFHKGVDSIISVKYMFNEYSDNEPDLNFTYDEKEMPLHYFERTRLVYSDDLNYVATTTKRETGVHEILQLTFNEAGNPIYMKTEKPSSEMFNEEKMYNYDASGRLVLQTRTGYNVMEYESGNTDISTDTSLMLNYGKNNLIESAKFSMGIGMTMNVETENVGDTIRYLGEMIMTGMMAESMPPGEKKRMKKTVMEIVFNEETDSYEAIEKKRGGIISKQIIDKSGKTLERIDSSKDMVMKHEKYSYENGKLNGVEVVKGDAPDIEYNDQGQKISEQTRMGMMKYEYDDKGNLIKEMAVNPYSLELEELTIHTIYYRK